MVLLATSALAACSSGTTGTLPPSPQTQSFSQIPNHAAGSAARGVGMQATVHVPNGIAPSNVPEFDPGAPMGTSLKAKPMFAEAPNPCPAGTQEVPDGGGFTCDPVNPNPPPVQGPTGCGTGAYNGCAPPCYTGQGGAGCIANNASCPGALSKNTTTDGTNQHNSQISNVLSFWFDAPSGNEEIAYEYQTYGGQEYIQFNYAIAVAIGPVSIGNSMSPLYHLNGSWFSTLQDALSAVHKTTKDLPPPYNTLSQFSAHELPCTQKAQG